MAMFDTTLGRRLMSEYLNYVFHMMLCFFLNSIDHVHVLFVRCAFVHLEAVTKGDFAALATPIFWAR